MLLATQEAIGALFVHRRAKEQAQHSAHLVVKFLRRISPLFNSFLIGLAQVVIVVCVGSIQG